ncbi:MAG TPA: hypothetical protein PK657_08360 [Legionella sp.]|nr:hypothetical protein [Legionella sp.]
MTGILQKIAAALKNEEQFKLALNDLINITDFEQAELIEKFTDIVNYWFTGEKQDLIQWINIWIDHLNYKYQNSQTPKFNSSAFFIQFLQNYVRSLKLQLTLKHKNTNFGNKNSAQHVEATPEIAPSAIHQDFQKINFLNNKGVTADIIEFLLKQEEGKAKIEFLYTHFDFMAQYLHPSLMIEMTLNDKDSSRLHSVRTILEKMINIHGFNMEDITHLLKIYRNFQFLFLIYDSLPRLKTLCFSPEQIITLASQTEGINYLLQINNYAAALLDLQLPPETINRLLVCPEGKQNLARLRDLTNTNSAISIEEQRGEVLPGNKVVSPDDLVLVNNYQVIKKALSNTDYLSLFIKEIELGVFSLEIFRTDEYNAFAELLALAFDKCSIPVVDANKFCTIWQNEIKNQAKKLDPDQELTHFSHRIYKILSLMRQKLETEQNPKPIPITETTSSLKNNADNPKRTINFSDDNPISNSTAQKLKYFEIDRGFSSDTITRMLLIKNSRIAKILSYVEPLSFFLTPEQVALIGLSPDGIAKLERAHADYEILDDLQYNKKYFFIIIYHKKTSALDQYDERLKKDYIKYNYDKRILEDSLTHNELIRIVCRKYGDTILSNFQKAYKKLKKYQFNRERLIAALCCDDGNLNLLKIQEALTLLKKRYFRASDIVAINNFYPDPCKLISIAKYVPICFKIGFNIPQFMILLSCKNAFDCFRALKKNSDVIKEMNITIDNLIQILIKPDGLLVLNHLIQIHQAKSLENKILPVLEKPSNLLKFSVYSPYQNFSDSQSTKTIQSDSDQYPLSPAGTI